MIFSLIIFLFLLINYLFFLNRIKTGLQLVKKTKPDSIINEFITIIIPFRNEEGNIQRSVESLINQDYDKDNFEIIYVDDNSEDSSVKLLKNYTNDNNVRIISTEIGNEQRAHKKLALQKAIEIAKGEIIITTDADCYHGKEWLKTMAWSFESNTGFVSGPVEFVSYGKLFDEIQKIEFASLILVGAGLIGIKQPIICNAANLGFRKSAYNSVGGYQDNLNLSSGDDEFLMQKIFYRTDYEVKFVFDKSAISFTEPNNSFHQFYHQRKRWASKSLYYVKKSTVLNLILIFLFYLGLPIQLLLGIFVNNIFYLSFVISLILKLIFEYQIVITKSSELFGRFKLSIFLIAELFHVPYILISGVSGLFGNYKWKDRKVER